MEYWNMHVHGLDSTRLPRSLRGLHRVERECHQLGTGVVRHWYVQTYISSIFTPHEPYSAIRIQIALALAWPACILCIIRRLYHIASPTTVSTTRTDVRSSNRTGFS